MAQQKPLFIMLDGDVAQTLGAMLREELDVRSEILVIDGVVLWDFDYIDLGRIRLPSKTVPVTIKSLVFSEDPRLPRGKAHLHHHDHDHGHERAVPRPRRARSSLADRAAARALELIVQAELEIRIRNMPLEKPNRRLISR